jgi:hypothetical protein
MELQEKNTLRIKTKISAMDILVHLIIWFFISLVTVGIGIFFFPYAFSKFVINHSELVDETGRTRKMNCDTDLFANIGHVILWILISIVTFGIGYAFYFYKVWAYSLNNTVIE